MPLSDPVSSQAPPPSAEEVFSAYDDLKVVGRSLDDDDALTLTAVVRNEMFYLPPFLEHYRKLGVERFVIIDDKSTDGSLDFLTSQPDCMVLHSDYWFNENVPLHPHYVGKYEPGRIRNVWTNLLVRRFGMNRWSVHVDADEFLVIPDGKRIQDLLPGLDAQEGCAVWSLMIDLYPATIQDLHDQAGDAHLNPETGWYFDARKHARFRSDGRLRNIYGGSRARLMDQFGIRKPKKRKHLNPIKAFKARFKQTSYNLLRKAPLLKIPADGFLYNSHKPHFPNIHGLVLPLEHFKFTGQIIERVQSAIERNSHFNNSVQYQDMERLLSAMTQANASFLTASSTADRSFKSYRRARIAEGDKMLG